jgi:CheY-like chemotaxis protein
MPATLQNRRVLVVEDEYFIAEEIVVALRRQGAEIAGPVGSAAEALQLLDKGVSIDLAVLDIHLRGGDSFEVARALKARDTPFVFATGYDGSALPADQHGVPLWEKPFDASALMAALLELEEARRPSAPSPLRSAG